MSFVFSAGIREYKARTRNRPRDSPSPNVREEEGSRKQTAVPDAVVI